MFLFAVYPQLAEVILWTKHGSRLFKAWSTFFVISWAHGWNWKEYTN